MNKQIFKSAALTAAILSLAAGTAEAQTPGNFNNNGLPSTTAASTMTTPGAIVLTANNGASAFVNNAIYFKVYNPGAGTSVTDFYSNPTAWMTAADFHLRRTNLKMYDNNYLELGNGMPKEINAGKICYSCFSGPQDVKLDIVGGGASWASRKIKLWAEGGVSIEGDVLFENYKGVKFSSGTADRDARIAGSGDGSLVYTTTFDKPNIWAKEGVFNGATTTTKLMELSGSTGFLKIAAAGGLDLAMGANGALGSGVLGYIADADKQYLSIAGGAAQGKKKLLLIAADSMTAFKGAVSINAQNFNVPAALADQTSLANTKLFVNGGILAKGSIICNGTWADYVFSPDYKLNTLEAVESHIKAEGHLPGMPSATEIEANGIDIAKIARMQQEKIEELTLYLIEMKKKVDKLEAKEAAGH